MPKRSGHADKQDSRGACVCDYCGWSFPNPNPSDRHKRAHKRVCETNEGDRPGNDDARHKIHLDVEHVSDDECKNPSGEVLPRCISRSSREVVNKWRRTSRFNDKANADADAITATGLYVGESSDGGAIQAMASIENIHLDETKRIAENPNADGGAIQVMASTENIHLDETKRIAENPNADQSTNVSLDKKSEQRAPNQAFIEGLKRNFALMRAMDEAYYNFRDKATMKASECEVKAKITEDTTLRVVPRIKLNFTIGCTKGDIVRLMLERTVKSIIIKIIRNPRRSLFLRLFDDDVHVHYVSEPKWTNDDDMFVVAKGSVFIRDPKLLQNKAAVVSNRDVFLQKMSTVTYGFDDASYKIRLSLPFGEDVNRMMSSISKTQSGVSMEPPTLVMKGLPFEWFAEQPDLSKPSKQLLLHLFKNFGNVRKLDVFGDGVFIQFEDCYKALQLLCSSSLQKEGFDEIADYKIMWKDEIRCDSACEDTSNVSKVVRFRRALGDKLVVTPPAKIRLQKKMITLQERAAMIEEELKDFVTHVNELVQELN